MKKSLRFYLAILFFSIIISIPLIIPYLHSGFFPTHDGEWAVVRLVEMFREFKDLQFPPRFSGSLNFGYGYPLFNFAYPFPYYLGIFIHLLGFNFLNSIKIIFALTIPFSAFFMFLASRNIWKNDFAGIVSSVLYLYFPYRLVDLYVRGSIGESVAFAIFPLIILCIFKSFESKRNIFYLITASLSYAILITTHNISAVLFSLSLFLFFTFHFLTNKNKLDVFKNYLFFITFGLLLSAFFWIPAIIEKKNIILSVIPIADRSQYFVTVKEFLFDSWGYEVPTDKKNGFTYQIGWPFLAVLILTTGFLIYQKYKKINLSNDAKQAILLIFGISIFIFMLFPASMFIWSLPILSEINFPWITFAQIGLLTSLLAGYLVKQKNMRYLILLITILALILYIPNAKPSEFIQPDEDLMYISNDRTTTSSSELMPVWVISGPVERYKEKVEVLEGDVKIYDISHNSKIINFTVESNSKSVIRINMLYYPGWEFSANSKLINVNYENDRGVMDISLPAGKYFIEGEFSETRLRLISDLISLFTLIIITGVFIFGVFKLKNESN